MTRTKVVQAVTEAERFIRKARALLASQSYVDKDVETCKHVAWDGGDQPMLQGAVRRASMDLTRALADMRRPGA